jgi:hypothetical protein
MLHVEELRVLQVTKWCNNTENEDLACNNYLLWKITEMHTELWWVKLLKDVYLEHQERDADI